MLNSPLEQFEILCLIPILNFSTFIFAITNSTLFIIMTLVILLIFLQLLTYKITIIPNR